MLVRSPTTTALAAGRAAGLADAGQHNRALASYYGF
jgi:hypothetical protein